MRKPCPFRARSPPEPDPLALCPGRCWQVLLESSLRPGSSLSVRPQESESDSLLDLKSSLRPKPGPLQTGRPGECHCDTTLPSAGRRVTVRDDSRDRDMQPGTGRQAEARLGVTVTGSLAGCHCIMTRMAAAADSSWKTGFWCCGAADILRPAHSGGRVGLPGFKLPGS